MSKKTYKISGKQVFYGNEEADRLVAVLDDDGNPVYEPGMVGAHNKRLTEWLTSVNGISNVPLDESEMECNVVPDEAVAHEEEPNTELLNDPAVSEELPHDGNTNVFVGSVPVATVENPEKPEEEYQGDGWVIAEIPESRLPSFDKSQGVNTPGFQAFVKENKFSEAQIAALVNRMEKR